MINLENQPLEVLCGKRYSERFYKFNINFTPAFESPWRSPSGLVLIKYQARRPTTLLKMNSNAVVFL